MKFWSQVCGVVIAAATFAGSVDAAVVKLRFAGSFDPDGQSATMPFDFELVYDTARNTSQAVALSGQVVDGVISVANDFYGYSRSGILSTNFRYGGMTWTVDDLDEVIVSSSLTADFFLDADIASATPTRFALEFFNTQSLFVGGLYSKGLGGPRIYGLHEGVNFFDPSNDLYGLASLSREVLVSDVPEPSSIALVGIALLGLCARLRRLPAAA